MTRKSMAGEILDRIRSVFEKMIEKIRPLRVRCQPVVRKTRKVFADIWYILKLVGRWSFKLRSLFLAIPVAVAAIALALRNLHTLPEQVSFDLLTSGEYAYTISRGLAVFGPLAVTGVCLLLMACSRRVVYPWLISIFSLVLPLLFMFTSLLSG